MQISDLVSQYSNNLSSQAEPVTTTKGVEQLVSTIRELTVGNIFEGTINSVKNGQVVLGLSNGRLLHARMDGKVPIQQGQSMFFQVKSNQDGVIAIKPFTVDGNGVNLTLVNALKAAGLPTDGNMLSMVNKMMEEQMPIDRNSLNQMARLWNSNKNIQPQTLVELKKLNIPVTVENASQFENYMEDKQAITKEMNSFVEEFPKFFFDTKMDTPVLLETATKMLDVFSSEMPKEALPLKAVLTDFQISSLQKQVLEVFGGKSDSLVHTINPEQTLHDFLSELKQTISNLSNSSENVENFGLYNKSELGERLLKSFFSGKEFQAIVKNTIENQWMIKPEDIEDGKQIIRLYERLEKQLTQMDEVLKNVGQGQSRLSQMTNDIHQNIQFMNQINELYTYVQIPLKMSGQTASGELFVYTNKKELQDPEADLTAFLHLDMDHLGSTDVSLRLHNKTEVTTNFYLEDDVTYDLIKAHLPILDEKLKKKGFVTTFTVTNEGKSVNFVEDFLKMDQPVAGTLRRYSFDMRA